MSKMSPSEIAKVAHDAGFRGEDLKIAVAVALAESGGKPGINAVGSEDSRGLWQINSVHFGRYNEKRLYEPQYNAKAAHDVYRDAGGFTPWTMYTNGQYRNHLDEAARAVRNKPWASGRGGSSRRGGDRTTIHPWRLPRNTVGRAGRIVVDPEHLRQLARHLTGHLAEVEAVYHRCRRHTDELDIDKINVEHQRYEKRLKHALEEALEDWHGLRRLAPLLANDIGFVVEARERALGADRDHGDARRSVEGLIATLRGPGASHTKGTRKHVAELLRQLYRPDANSRHLRHHLPTTPGSGGGRPHGGGGGGKGGNSGRPSLRNVNVSGGWGGTKSVFDQFVTPFLRRHDLAPGSQKRNYDTVAGPGMSDHYVGSSRSYAIDYPTYSGEDEARALARAMGNNSWQPNSYNSFTVNVDGTTFRVQILWGAAIDHADHIHVGVSRA